MGSVEGGRIGYRNLSLFLLSQSPKTQPVRGFDVACKCPRKYRGVSVKEGWFILTNLGSLKSALAAYQKRMGIKKMFRDYKSGGYYLEGTDLKGQRVIALILLIALAYK